MDTITDVTTIPVGVVGLGLMGCSITTCLLLAGHKVVAVAPVSTDLQHAAKRIRQHLLRSKEKELIDKEPGHYLEQLVITEDYCLLKDCTVVIECTIEDTGIKKSVYDKIEAVISSDAILTSNTSAIPISILQKINTIPSALFWLALGRTFPHHQVS